MISSGTQWTNTTWQWHESPQAVDPVALPRSTIRSVSAPGMGVGLVGEAQLSPFIAYHATARRHRQSIRHFGLLVGGSHGGRPSGVYVYRDDYSHPTRVRAGVIRWGSGGCADLWEAAYIGPLTVDRFVENGIILLERVPPQHLSLITDIT